MATHITRQDWTDSDISGEDYMSNGEDCLIEDDGWMSGQKWDSEAEWKVERTDAQPCKPDCNSPHFHAHGEQEVWGFDHSIKLCPGAYWKHEGIAPANNDYDHIAGIIAARFAGFACGKDCWDAAPHVWHDADGNRIVCLGFELMEKYGGENWRETFDEPECSPSSPDHWDEKGYCGDVFCKGHMWVEWYGEEANEWTQAYKEDLLEAYNGGMGKDEYDAWNASIGKEAPQYTAEAWEKWNSGYNSEFEEEEEENNYWDPSPAKLERFNRWRLPCPDMTDEQRESG